MRLDISPPSNAFEVVTKRWGLQNAEQILQTYRSTVYRVESPKGPAKLKLYTQIGYRGERAAISFSKSVSSNAIAKIYQNDFYRAAVLSEWVEGPTVQEVLQKGDYEKATRLACEVIRSLTETSRIRFPFAYRRKTATQYRTLRQKFKNGQSPQNEALLAEGLGIFERLLSRRRDERVIHGDLHYENMIQTPIGARAIDPRGVRAHPVVNCQSLFIDSGAEIDLSAFAKVFSDQVQIFTENLGFDRDTVMQLALFARIWRTLKIGDDRQALRERRLREVELIRSVIAQT
ncbi:aminoglycoside phosphotransferase family protein [Cognatiyoonia sp. IB215182]|uniref:aminoglycoside phosphotransferase family protein n=1 Tax=Cognatiyoonia sp. IB215182 TaxID=3097353 RepID=UPI002A0E8998|nr:aminoglycoside phosphotransferase family protein [Cognatiyoonia sp. IB215182]MDX8350891.1 aminoglycoside phosphotransferase family protein [Cognatiyoonia sp. IB215182]